MLLAQLPAHDLEVGNVEADQTIAGVNNTAIVFKFEVLSCPWCHLCLAQRHG